MAGSHLPWRKKKKAEPSNAGGGVAGTLNEDGKTGGLLITGGYFTKRRSETRHGRIRQMAALEARKAEIEKG
jgi:hypothetical protein